MNMEQYSLFCAMRWSESGHADRRCRIQVCLFAS